MGKDFDKFFAETEALLHVAGKVGVKKRGGRGCFTIGMFHFGHVSDGQGWRGANALMRGRKVVDAGLRRHDGGRLGALRCYSPGPG